MLLARDLVHVERALQLDLYRVPAFGRLAVSLGHPASEIRPVVRDLEALLLVRANDEVLVKRVAALAAAVAHDDIRALLAGVLMGGARDRRHAMRVDVEAGQAGLADQLFLHLPHAYMKG